VNHFVAKKQYTYGLVLNCSGVTEFGQVENKAPKHVFGKRIFSWWIMYGNEIHLQFSRHITCFVLGD